LDNIISHDFALGAGAQYFEDYIHGKYGNPPPVGTDVTDFAYTFTWGRALTTPNLSEQFIGSWQNGKAYVTEDTVYYQLENTTGLGSLGFGRQLN